MSNLISSAFYPSAPEHLECHINGRKTGVDFDATKIKCPICNDIMVLSSLNDDGESHEEEVLVQESRHGCSYTMQRVHTTQIGVTCPNCGATLTVNVTDIYRIGRKLDIYKVNG